jgi:Flp pilus assembly protein TadB
MNADVDQRRRAALRWLVGAFLVLWVVSTVSNWADSFYLSSFGSALLWGLAETVLILAGVLVVVWVVSRRRQRRSSDPPSQPS